MSSRPYTPLGFLVVIGCGASAIRTPTASTRTGADSPSVAPPSAHVDIVLDLEADGAAAAAPVFSRRLEAAGVHAEVTARSRREVLVRVLAGDPEIVGHLAAAGEVLVAPVDDGFDLAAAADAPPPACVEPMPERIAHRDGTRGRYLRCPASEAPALSTWIGRAHPPADRIALMGFDDLPEGSPRVRTFVISRDALVSSADVSDATDGADDAGSFVTMRIENEASRRLEVYTRAHERERLAFVAAGRVVAAPIIAAPIASRELRVAVGSAADGPERARRLAEALRAGALPSALHVRAR